MPTSRPARSAICAGLFLRRPPRAPEIERTDAAALAQHQSLEAQLLAQNVRQNLRRGVRRHAVDGRIGGHHAERSRPDARHPRRQEDFPQHAVGDLHGAAFQAAGGLALPRIMAQPGHHFVVGGNVVALRRPARWIRRCARTDRDLRCSLPRCGPGADPGWAPPPACKAGGCRPRAPRAPPSRKSAAPGPCSRCCRWPGPREKSSCPSTSPRACPPRFGAAECPAASSRWRVFAAR